ncbi:SAVED domain-containing protein [Nannocystis sp. RBIL2]|uniref:SAVED domain-containing protein n=1 Tax=Nannocystis sp. RBIL2 TaxID=2996788 RepID=UPI002271AF86|nr:SAVED domain-containing protein [Nannocystis sp. RBIL2]MCY1071189.1 SAVED domain-containing protein [Nannocystis sp. RBIL2]
MAESQNKQLHIVIVLDPWRDNEIRTEQFEGQIPSGRQHVLRLSEFGVVQTARSATEIAWDAWLDAADEMIESAAEHARRLPDHDVHYYLTGRAALPLFAYVATRLSKWATITVLNRYENEWHHVPIRRPPEGTRAPFFSAVRQLDGLDGSGKVAVFVSTEHTMDFAMIREYMKEQGTAIAGVLEISTNGVRRLITDANADSASDQLDREIQGIRRRFHQHTGLVIFVAGPAQLAAMVGRSINPNIHGPVEFPNYAATSYVPALRYPRRIESETLRILALGASPRDEARLDIDTEFRELKHKLRDAIDSPRFELFAETAVTTDDLMWCMNAHDPHVVHLSAHGSEAGDICLVDPANKGRPVPMAGIVRALRAAGPNVRVVVVNACFSAKLAVELQRYFDFVIGVDQPLNDKTAISFTKGFYRALAFGKSLESALEQGRAQVEADNRPGADDIRGYCKEGFDSRGWIPLPRRPPKK